MKIKAIVMALLVSGGLLLANRQDLDIKQRQEQIDRAEINPLDPNLMREIIKAIVRIDNNVGVNSKEIEKISNAFYELSRTFTQAINMQMIRLKS